MCAIVAFRTLMDHDVHIKAEPTSHKARALVQERERNRKEIERASERTSKDGTKITKSGINFTSLARI